MSVWLVITREAVRVVKRRPYPRPGEWVVRVNLTFPPRPDETRLDVALVGEPPLAGVEAEQETP